jgi:uncharacterized protein YecT (DUF1311 family)
VGELMKLLSGLSALLFTSALLAGVGCRKQTKANEAANMPQDTMLMRDLAEANRNTAAATAVDNSLNTVRMSGAASSTTFENTSPRPTDRAATQPLPPGSQVLTSRPTLTVPTTANDAPKPTTVPLELSPANSLATRSTRDPCDSPSLTDQRNCLNRSIVENDADLNRTYRELISQARKSGGSDLEEKFRQSQREWVDQRDADCASQAQSADGKLWARARAICLAEYSSRRTAELQRNLSSLRGSNSN